MRSRRAAITVIGSIFWGLPIAAYAVAPLVLPNHNANGQCEGLGWGCRPTPADGLRLLVIIGAPVWLVGGAVALLLTVWIHSRSARSRQGK